MMDAKVEKVARGSGFKGDGLLDPKLDSEIPKARYGMLADRSIPKLLYRIDSNLR